MRRDPWLFAVALLALATTAGWTAEPQGRLLSVEGTVERSADRGAGWNPAASDDDVFEHDLVKTGGRSRCALLLVDETQLRLNAYSLLEIRSVRVGGAAGGADTRLNLQQGEAWLRSKNPRRALVVDTASATAAIRGTEVNVKSDGDVTEIVVVEGEVDFFNDHGSVNVRGGEGARARVGEAPEKFVVLNPEDAVQWVIFYPDFQALSASPDSAPGSPDALFDAAADALRFGDAAGAAGELRRALALEPRHRSSLALLALIELTRNETEQAAATIERALEVGDEHFLTRLVASKVEQARFRLPEAVTHARAALALEPRSVEAAASLAELLYGSARTAEAAGIVDEQLLGREDDARLLTLRGFIAFGLDRVAAAEDDFVRAIRLDATRADAHLGLGLARFQQGRKDEGLEELLAATCLAPQVSLYQSYLGKAYHEQGRYETALTSLATAIRLDPRDPTPHLYAALINRDLNRHSVAAAELAQAIRKNDYRAVYRSRLLLDRDQATSNVTLARIYENIRWTALGAYHATRSLELDYGNAAAHLFAAGTLINEPDRTAAATSELLVARLLQPVNENSFNTFNQYSSLLTTGKWEPSLRTASGRNGESDNDGVLSGGNNRVALFALLRHGQDDGLLGPNSDTDDNVGNVAAKLALGTHQSLLLDVQAGDSELGTPGDVTSFVDQEGGLFTLRVLRPTDPDLNDRLRLHIDSQFVGYHNRVRPNQNLLFAYNREVFDRKSTDPDFFADDPLPALRGCGTRSFGEDSLDALQAAHHVIRDRHQFFGGAEWAERRKRSRDTVFCTTGPFAGQALETGNQDLTDRAKALWGRYSVRGSRDSSLTVGLRYDALDLQDSLGSNVFPVDEDWISPHLGLRWQFDERTALRVAAFRNVHGVDNARVSPQLISGFSLRRSEFAPDTVRDEVDLALDREIAGRGFVGLTLYRREIEAPRLTFDDQFNIFRVRQESRTDGAKLDVNWRLHPYWTSFAELQHRVIDTRSFEQNDFQGRIGVRFVHPSGWFFDAEEVYLDQSYHSAVAGLPETRVWLTQVAAVKEYPQKRARIGLNVQNLFDRDFNVAIDDLSVAQRYPTLRAQGFLELNF